MELYTKIIENLPEIISAMAVIITAWLSYNQYTKNKQTDAKLEAIKRDETERAKVRSDNQGRIYGVLWHTLHELSADRVYILQPHPLSANHFISVSYEVRRNGVSAIRPHIQNFEMANVAIFSDTLGKREYLQYMSVTDEVRDKRARALLSIGGATTCFIKRLSNDEYAWVGSIFVEFIDTQPSDAIYCKKVLSEAADAIQYILPEYK